MEDKGKVSNHTFIFPDLAQCIGKHEEIERRNKGAGFWLVIGKKYTKVMQTLPYVLF